MPALKIAPGTAAVVAGAASLVLMLGIVVALRPSLSSTLVSERSPVRTEVQTQQPPPPALALNPPTRRLFPTREVAAASRLGTTGTRPGPDASGGWWFGTAGVALALALVGWGSVAAKRYRPLGSAGPVAMRVVGRTSLSPKHTVYLLDVGGRILILGAGAQGAPSLLGELADRASSPPRFDHRPEDES